MLQEKEVLSLRLLHFRVFHNSYVSNESRKILSMPKAKIIYVAELVTAYTSIEY